LPSAYFDFPNMKQASNIKQKCKGHTSKPSVTIMPNYYKIKFIEKSQKSLINIGPLK